MCVIVTGGGTGIGRATAELFAKHGAQVLITGRRLEPLVDLSDQYPKNISFLQADVTDAAARATIIQTAIDRHGRLDTLVNNAGLAPNGGFQQTTDDDFANTYLTNVIAPAALIRLAVPLLKESKGSVVNVSTAAAHAAVPGAAPYVCSKAALDQLTRVLAVELGPLGIRVNAVAPGATRTALSKDIIEAWGADAMISMTPLGRLGEPVDIARTVFFLASREADWVTGQVLDASGGLML